MLMNITDRKREFLPLPAFNALLFFILAGLNQNKKGWLLPGSHPLDQISKESITVFPYPET